MKHLLKLLVVLFVVSSCKEAKNETTELKPGTYEVVAQEVLHVKEYSYIKVLENGQEKWLAAPITKVETGQKYYYGNSMEMKNFKSEELNKTFETIYFIEKLSTDPSNTSIHSATTQEQIVNQQQSTPEPKETSTKKTDLPEGAISIAELFKNKEKYEGQVVTLSGEVTKYNPGIMGVNWFHIQDGTNFEGNGDLTATTNDTVVMGETVTFKGVVTLNKDFGAGYFYNVIIEKAEIIK